MLIALEMHQEMTTIQQDWRLGFIMCYNIIYHKFRGFGGMAVAKFQHLDKLFASRVKFSQGEWVSKHIYFPKMM